MCTRKIYLFLGGLLILYNLSTSEGSILDWIWPDRGVFQSNLLYSGSSPLPTIPFEISETNDKFITDVSKVLGIRLSELDFCQQRVILSLKSSCNKLNDEELGKLAIALLNCQHFVEKRRIIDCTPKVALADCLSQMTDEMKASYTNILGRTKSVCLVIRQDQFRGMTELTINNLMSQVERLRQSQQHLEQASLNSIDEITVNQLKLYEQQNELLRLAEEQKFITEENRKQLLKEKATLQSGHADLNLFISKLRSSMDDGIHKLNEQNIDMKHVFRKLAKELAEINDISKRITAKLIDVDEMASLHEQDSRDNFHKAMQRLHETNDIIESFARNIDRINNEFYSKLKWLEPLVGSGDEFTARVNLIVIHTLYLLFGMLCLVFINANTMSRFLLLSIVFGSLLLTLLEFISLHLLWLVKLLIAIVLVNFINVFNSEYNMMTKVKDLFEINSKEPKYKSESKEIPIPVQIEKNGYKSSPRFEFNNNIGFDEEHEEIVVNQSNSYTAAGGSYSAAPLSSRQTKTFSTSADFERFSNGNVSRRATPTENGDGYHCGDLGRCRATTRNGVRCQLTTPSKSIEFCRIHERSSRER